MTHHIPHTWTYLTP